MRGEKYHGARGSGNEDGMNLRYDTENAMKMQRRIVAMCVGNVTGEEYIIVSRERSRHPDK